VAEMIVCTRTYEKGKDHVPKWKKSGNKPNIKMDSGTPSINQGLGGHLTVLPKVLMIYFGQKGLQNSVNNMTLFLF
jgi:hypothetical protein